ncbi:TetR family transcriptional regulator [Halanaerobium sp. DL-01]|uniref:TetR/AcrR family transcriptional regulator n=1 Tax=Halanaerobium sp. DL-01 TaxID=1653064 RepID=UPI000DF3B01F|nr:TetR/AcrR family transcriptional regulator [Halanaerobium sp. DL-01]RCW88008.1 TetR family transcriptional regulator [Halanaerobium sp. DL-01]
MAKFTKKSIERRNVIMEEAEKLFVEKGFEKTTVKDIADKSGVAKGTFYYYFDTKEDIITALLEKRYKKTEEKALRIAESDRFTPIEKIERILLRLIFDRQDNFKIYEFFKIDENAKIMKKRNKEFRDKFIPIFTEVVKEGIKKGDFETDYPEEVTDIMFMGVDGFLHKHYATLTTEEMYKGKFSAVEEVMSRSLNLKDRKIDLSLMKPEK